MSETNGQGNPRLDRRHDRRPLAAAELQSVVSAARQGNSVFRGLSGVDRAALYVAGYATGFRAAELSSLCPADFDLHSEPATATLSANRAKNGKTAVQPLPPDVAEFLAGYLTDRPADLPIWPGTWPEKAAEMEVRSLTGAGAEQATAH